MTNLSRVNIIEIIANSSHLRGLYSKVIFLCRLVTVVMFTPVCNIHHASRFSNRPDLISVSCNLQCMVTGFRY